MDKMNNKKPVLKVKSNYLRKPSWLYTKIQEGGNLSRLDHMIEENGLHTICSSGKCPNKGHCWRSGTATFMIMGDICTRRCRFCATMTGHPLPLDTTEPIKVARSIKAMGLKHCVVTSVDRDDLPDKGARHWAETIKRIRELCPEIIIEVLIPDYRAELLSIVLDAHPDIVGHNMETVKRLSPEIRSNATYQNSLEVLGEIAKSGFLCKSGIMVGLGETFKEVCQTLDDMRKAGVRMVTIGQYLQPTDMQAPVLEYVHPDVFEEYKKYALSIGFSACESGPFVRSSYMAERSFVEMLVRESRSMG